MSTPDQAAIARQRRLYVIVLAAALACAALFCIKTIQILSNGATTQATDLSSYLAGAARLRQGQPLYDPALDLAERPLTFIYPPPLAILFLPVSDYRTAWWGWSAFSLLCWIAALAMIWRALAGPLRERVPPLWRPILLIALANFPPLFVHMIWGQVQLLLLLLLTGGWLALRRGRDGLAGVLLGLAIVIKLYPAVLLLPLLLRRRWRASAAAALTAGLVLTGSFAFVGWGQLEVYVTRVVPEINETFNNIRPDNNSITMTLRLLLGSAGLAAALSLAIRGAIIAALAFAAARRRASEAELFVLGATSMILLAPVIWPHYFVLAYLPWLTALAASQPRQRGWLAVSYALIATASLIYYIPAALWPAAQLLPLAGVGMLFAIQLAHATARPPDPAPAA